MKGKKSQQMAWRLTGDRRNLLGCAQLESCCNRQDFCNRLIEKARIYKGRSTVIWPFK